MRDFKQSVKLWSTSEWVTKYLRSTNPVEIAEGERYVTYGILDSDMTDSGWVLLGTAEVSGTIVEGEELFQAQVKGLQAEIAAKKVAAFMAITELEEKLQSLLALPAPEAVSAQTPMPAIPPTSELFDDDIPF